jgi:cytochrome c6
MLRVIVTAVALLPFLTSAADRASDKSTKAASHSRTTANDGTQIFRSGTTPSCATCHALSDAGATGNIGPDLDQLKPDAERVARAVKHGFEAMPPFGHVLTDAQIQAVARYVESATGAR